MQSGKIIPLIITVDLECAYDHNEAGQIAVLEKLNNDMKSLNLPVTYFVTGEFASRYPEAVKKLFEAGNEIGCHGMYHTRTENYKRLEEESIKGYLNDAGSIIENLIFENPICFRGPGMTTSSATQKILKELGYKADFSVCSGRIDFFNSTGGDIRWLFSPKVTYHPSEGSPYKKGNMPICVVPLSSVCVPFMSGILYLFGFGFMKFIFRRLRKKSKKYGRAVVYLFHTYEFSEYSGTKEKTGAKEKYKRPLLHRFYLSDRAKRYKKNMDLLKYIISFNDIVPFTGSGYIKYLKGQK